MLSFLLSSENWEDLLRVVFKTSRTSEAQCSACAGCPWRLKDTLNWEHGQGGCDSSLSPPSLPWMCLCVSALIYLFPQVCVLISSYSVLPIAFAEIALLSITTCSILISLVNVTNILLIFFSKLIIIVWNRIESSNFLCEDSPRGFTDTSLC